MNHLKWSPQESKWFHIISCHVLWRELCYFAALSPNIFTFHFLKQGLHNTPELLRQEVQRAIDNSPEECHAILLGYGLCSNGISHVTARNKPLVIMRGHDCITFLLGSKEKYQTYFAQHPGTYWFSPGWIDTNLQPGPDRYEKTRQHYIELYGKENADYLMEMEQNWIRKYSNAAYVDLGFGDTTHYKEYTKTCARWLNWNYDILEGDPGLIINFINGNWKDEDFLIIPPGETIVPSHKECILARKDNNGTVHCCQCHVNTRNPK